MRTTEKRREKRSRRGGEEVRGEELKEKKTKAEGGN